MEIADALYGVTMRGDGVSAVISQRLRERASPSEPAASPAPRTLTGRPVSCLDGGAHAAARLGDQPPA